MKEQEILECIGQIDSTMTKVSSELDTNTFYKYCNSAYDCISILRVLLKEQKDKIQDEEN